MFLIFKYYLNFEQIRQVKERIVKMLTPLNNYSLV